MNINTYTNHFCDRFVLGLVACVGLIGTSYILMDGKNQESRHIQTIELGISHNNIQQNRSSYQTIQTAQVVIDVEPQEDIASEEYAGEFSEFSD